jgi:hypothetical protein
VVLSNDLAQVSTQCNRAQSANKVTLRSIEGKSQKSEAAAQKALNSLKGKVEALTESRERNQVSQESSGPQDQGSR